MGRNIDEELLYREVGRRVRQARKNHGLTQAQLASSVALSRTSITNIEKGRQKLLLHTLSDIAFVLGVEPGTLFPSVASAPLEDVESKMPHDLSQKEREHIRKVLASPSPRRT